VHDVKVGQRVEARFGDALSIGCTISHMPQGASAAAPIA
jgi:hypothetical protein